MRPGVMRRPKPSSEAEQQYKADVTLAGRRAELLDTAREAEARFREAQARRAPDTEVRRLAEDFDAALTAAMRPPTPRSAPRSVPAATTTASSAARLGPRRGCTHLPPKPSTCSPCGRRTASTTSRSSRTTRRPSPG